MCVKAVEVRLKDAPSLAVVHHLSKAELTWTLKSNSVTDSARTESDKESILMLIWHFLPSWSYALEEEKKMMMVIVYVNDRMNQCLFS